MASRLNLGVGRRPDPSPDVINVDRLDLPGVQVVHDLDVLPWPFGSEAFTEIRAFHVYEHLRDPLGFMAESWRVLGAGGTLTIVVPHWESDNAHTDPTHVRFCTERTWDYWIPGTILHGEAAYAGAVAFVKEAVTVIGDDIRAELRKA